MISIISFFSSNLKILFACFASVAAFFTLHKMSKLKNENEELKKENESTNDELQQTKKLSDIQCEALKVAMQDNVQSADLATTLKRVRASAKKNNI